MLGGVKPADKAKAVIEEIEEIKKIESAMLEAVKQGNWPIGQFRRRRSRSRPRGKSNFMYGLLKFVAIHGTGIMCNFYDNSKK